MLSTWPLQKGVQILKDLMQEDALLLSKFSLTTFNETPLHISAGLGHVAFSKALLVHKPKLASEQDSLKHTPLHFASAERHSEVTKQLVQVYNQASLDTLKVLVQEMPDPHHGEIKSILQAVRSKTTSCI